MGYDFNLIRRWKDKRRMKREVQALIDYIQGELERGVHPNDLLVYSLPSPVEWDQEGQFWKVLCDDTDIVLQVDELIELKSGRGGAKEGARIVEDLGGGWYSLRYDVDNRGDNNGGIFKNNLEGGE